MAKSTSSFKPELWCGMECTINRIGNQYLDQLEYSDFYQRPDDLEKFATTGMKAFRFPILWEKHQPQKNSIIDWSTTEERLKKLVQLNITPIAGLVHHGSGPAFTDLLDKKFPYLLAEYAKAVAEKFPFINYYTPVNEPLTTARFSGLYGNWYPHHRNALSFAKMMVNQAKGIVLSMKAIRSINPTAKLIQTEDPGKTYSTNILEYQSEFENHRRWLTYDLLCGNVVASHPMYKYFTWLGISKKDLSFFIENKCPPDIIGINHYVTSERFLDHNIEQYSQDIVGGNGKHHYADVEAARVKHDQPQGLKLLLQEVWKRYQIPIAITEVQLHCFREEQLRWFKYVWETCCELISEGIDIKAVTAWSMLGAFGWNKLLTVQKGEYETGVFDIRSGIPRPTALFSLIQNLNKGDTSLLPIVYQPGWWQRCNRFLNPDDRQYENSYSENNESARLLIIGKSGTLGNAFARICHLRAINYKVLGREEIDISDNIQIEQVINTYKPWAIINAAGFVRVDEAESEMEQCFLSNTIGPLKLAEACRQKGIRFMTFSSDLVFDGRKKDPYIESDKVYPLNVYGKSKAQCEEEVLNCYPDSLVVRTSAFFGPWDKYNFVRNVLTSISNNQPFTALHDVVISPTYVPDLVNFALDLLIDGESNIWHLSNNGQLTWYELAMEVADRSHQDSYLIKPLSLKEMPLKAPRPLYSVLKSGKGILLPTIDSALERFFSEKLQSA